MAGPGGKTVGKVGVRVLPDTSGFGLALERYLQRIEHTLRVQIKTELDTSGIANEAKKIGEKVAAGKINIPAEPDLQTAGFRAKLAAFGSTLKAVQVKVDVDTKDWASKLAFLRVSTLALGAATASLGFPGLAQGLGVLVQAAAGLSALVPAAIAAAAAVGVTLVVGLKGFGQALKDAGDPQKFAADLTTLAPSAAQTAIAIHNMAGAFKAMQLSVQQALFAGMATTLKQLANEILPTVSKGLTQVATGLNFTAKELANFLGGNFAKDTLSKVFSNTQAAVQNATPGLTEITAIILNLSNVGSSFLPRLATSFSIVSSKISLMVDAAVRSGALQAFIERALQTTTQLGHAVGAIGSIFQSVFKAASASGANLFGVLGSILSETASFLKSAPGQAALVSVFSVLRTLGQQVGAILGETLKAIGPLLVQIAPSLSRIAEVAGGALLSAIKILGPVLAVLPPILKFVADIVTTLEPVLKPLATGLIIAAAAFGVLNVVLTLLSLNPVILILIAIAAAATLIIKNWGPISGFFKVVGKAIADAFVGLGKFFVDLWNGIISVTKTVWNNFIGFFVTIFKAVSDAVKTAWDFISNIILGVSTAIINNTRFIWEPLVSIIGSIISIAVDLVRIVVLSLALFLIGAWNGIVAAAQFAWQVVQTVIIGPVQFIAAVIGNVIRGVIDFLRWSWDMISGNVRNVWDFIVFLTRNAWNTVFDAIAGPIRAIIGVVRDAVNAVVGVTNGAWNAVMGGVQAAWGGIIGFFRGVGGSILGALGDLGGLLVHAGRAVIDGLLSGIRSAFEAVKNFVGGIADWISSHKGPIAKDRKLLVPHGNAIMGGLLGGLKEGQKDVLSFLDGFMADISGTSVDLTAGGLGVTGSGKTGVPGVINVFPQPGQSEEAIASAAYRKFAFAGRISS